MAGGRNKKQRQRFQVWNYFYEPWAVGGDVWREVKAEVFVTGPYNLGKGYTCFIYQPSDDGCYVVEATTGAVIGGAATLEEALKEARKDVEDGDAVVMARQIEQSAAQVANAHVAGEDEFNIHMAKNAKEQWGSDE